MVKRLYSLAIAALLLFSFAPESSAQNRNSINGFVFADDRTPVSRVYVELQTELYSTIARTQTNGAGMFAFRGLASGRYTVKVLTTGTDFQEQAQSVSLVPISMIAGRGAVSEQVDFYLKSRRKAGPQGSAEVLFVQEIPQNAKDLYEAGVKELDAKNEALGFEKLKQSLEAFPDYFLALDRLGNEYLLKGYYDPARVLLTRAVAVNPRSISSGLALGLSEYRMNRFAEALEAFENVIKLDKGNTNAYYWKGVVLQALKKLDASIAALRKADDLADGKFPDVHWQLARALKDQNKFRESADALETFLRLKPDAVNAAEIRQIIKTLREKQGS